MVNKPENKPKEEMSEPRMVAIGEKLRELRVNKGFTNYEHFAWENKIPRNQYLGMEQGKNYTMASLLRVLDAHGITLEEFFKGLK